MKLLNIPPRNFQMVRYCGYYSNAYRGKRNKEQELLHEAPPEDKDIEAVEYDLFPENIDFCDF